MNNNDRLRSSIIGQAPPSYPPEKSGLLRLDANTNLFGPNPAVEQVLREAIPDVAQYPSPLSTSLVQVLSKHHSLSCDEIIVGNGSDEILDFITKAYLNPGDVVAVPSPSFVMHSFYGRINLGTVVEVPLLSDFSLPVDELLSCRPKLILLASPNNPTGNVFQTESLERVLTESDALVVVDEAYAEFCDQDFAARIREFENLVVVRTLSKAYGLAAVRVGYALARREIMQGLYAVKPPFTVGVIAERIAVAALTHPSFANDTAACVKKERARLSDAIATLGLTPRSTDANFMLIDLGRPASKVAAELEQKGILVRDMTSFPSLANYIRVTIGKSEHTDQLVAALRECCP